MYAGLLMVVDEGAPDLPPTTGWESPWLGDMDHHLFLKLQFPDDTIDGSKWPVDDFPTPTEAEESDPEDGLQTKEEPEAEEAEAEATADHYMIKCGAPVTHSQGVGDGICDMGHSEWFDVE